jgi:hypothetical protein
MARSKAPSAGGGAGGVLRLVERSGIRKGMNGSKGWFYVGTGLWTLRTVRRLAERNVELLVSEELKPGQRIVIANGKATIEGAPDPAPRGRRARKKLRKAETKAAAKAASEAAKASGRAARRAARAS